MLRKSLVAAGILALLGGVYAWDRANYNYLGAAMSDLKEAAKPSVEHQIRQAKEQLANVDEEIKKNKALWVRSKVNLEKLAERVARREGVAMNEKSELFVLKTRLEKGDELRFAGNVYTKEEVRDDMARRLNGLKEMDRELTALRSTFEAREKAFKATTQKVANMIKERDRLSQQLESLSAQLESVKAKEALAQDSLNDSELSELKALMNDIDTEVRVRQETASKETGLESRIPVKETAPADIEDQVNAYLQPDADKIVIGKKDR